MNSSCSCFQCLCESTWLWAVFFVHTWIAASLLWCLQFVCVFWTFALWGAAAVTSLQGKMHYNVVERRELDVESEISFRRQLLLMTQMKYESNECVCDWGCSHPCVVRWWITFLPPLATRWLSCWWWVASSCLSGGWWDVTVLQAAANMQPPLNPFTLPVQMSYSTIVTVRLIIPLTKQRLTSKYGFPFAPCFRNGRKPVATRVIITAYTETTGYRRRWAPDGHFLCQAGNGTELPRHHFSF